MARSPDVPARDGKDPVYEDTLLRIWHTHDPPGLRLSGEVDRTNQAAMAAHLLGVDGTARQVTVDLREVAFLNFAGLHTLAAYADSLETGRVLVLRTSSAVIDSMLTACGWNRDNGLPLRLLQEIPDD